MFLLTSRSGASATLARSNDDDLRPVFVRALALATDVVATTRLDQLDDPTPCRDFDVRQLLEHLVDVVERVGEIGRGGDLSTRPAVVRYVHDQEWLTAFCDAAVEAIDAWSDEAVLDRVIELPWSARPGRATLATYLNEVTVHTWDLARATGQHPAWDDVVVGMALDAVRVLTDGGPLMAFDAVGISVAADWGLDGEHAAGLPAETVAPFDDPLDLDAAAPLIDRLVAWNGRRP
jgi:uncharacterized protein (TIGR03086 family)